MTVESHQPDFTPSNAELVRTMALSSAELWHELLQRLTEVQQSQIALARSIEELGGIVRHALSGDNTPAIEGAATAQLGAGDPTQDDALAASASASASAAVFQSPLSQQRSPLSDQQSTNEIPTGDSALGVFPQPGIDVELPPPPAPAAPSSASVAQTSGTESSVAQANEAPVMALSEEPVLPDSGVVATGASDLDQESVQTPSGSNPLVPMAPVLGNLNADAMDALLVSEFGEASLVSASSITTAIQSQTDVSAE
ncbi:MAG TPA: hypothetical protein VEJ87_01615, partial [Acidimicrobiales bacterium]|nr:hypothetical protein [Acidimicrobiales bacterium]